VYSPADAAPLPSHLTSCTPTKYNQYLDISLETALNKLLMFHIPNFMSIFCPLGHLSKDTADIKSHVGKNIFTDISVDDSKNCFQ
jgi:hypothetical protein